jgi:hypothetical protein
MGNNVWSYGQLPNRRIPATPLNQMIILFSIQACEWVSITEILKNQPCSGSDQYFTVRQTIG